MEIEFSTDEQLIIDAIRKSSDSLGYDAFLIGGYIRDKIMERPTVDMDVVVVGDGIAVANDVAKHLGTRRPQIFKRFGTAMIRKGDIDLEFVGARKESYSINSRKPEVEPGTLEDDQLRRDFTINAMAKRISGSDYGQFIDPFDGLNDIQKKLIRTPADSDKTFSDDPLRMLRAIRFACQLNFTIDPETFGGIQRNKERIKIISQERITTEFNKILMSRKPSIGLSLLLYTGLIEIIFREFYMLKGVDYMDGKGHKDNYFHTAEVVDNVAKMSDNLWLRWSALLHDIAKPRTKRFDAKIGWSFHGHEVVGSKMVPAIFKRFKLPLDHKMHFVKKMVRLHQRPISLTKDNITDSAVRRLLFDAGEDIDELMTLCKADITTKNESKMYKYLANYEMVIEKMKAVEKSDHLRNWQPPITGELIMETFNLSPSRMVGDIKTAIREAILDGVISNDYDAAYDFMLKKGHELGLSQSK